MGGDAGAATGRGRPARLRQNEAADLLGITTRHLRRMAQTSEAHGLEVPRVGSGRRQRWKAEELLPWHDRVVEGQWPASDSVENGTKSGTGALGERVATGAKPSRRGATPRSASSRSNRPSRSAETAASRLRLLVSDRS